MTHAEQESIFIIALMVAFADGAKHDAECVELKLEKKAADAVDCPAEVLAVEPWADTAMPTVVAQPSAGDAQVDKMVLNYAILNFGSPTEQARTLHTRYAADIQQKAGSVNLSQLLQRIRGQQ